MSSTGLTETTESYEQKKTTHGSPNNIFDWIRYIFYAGADKHGNQLVQNRKTDFTYVRAAPAGRQLQLPLFLHKRLVLSPTRFNFAHSGLTFLQKTIQELVEQLERSEVIPTNCNCRAEETGTLSYDRSRSNGRQNTIHKFFEKRYWLPTFSVQPSRECR